MTNIFLASSNHGKIKEFSKLFKDYKKDIKLLSLKNLTTNKITEPNETGKTFEENSIIKAKYYAEFLHMSTIADDSGLCIKALNNFPGIYSARFNNGNKNYNFAFNTLKLLLDYNDIKDYSASFLCNITFYDYEEKKHYSFEGEVKGTLKFPPSGDNGFGYDPIFIPAGYNKSFAEFTMDEKNLISHRVKALLKFSDWFFSKNIK